MILELFRSWPRRWFSLREISQAVYGSENHGSRESAYQALYRLRAGWYDAGLRVEIKRGGDGGNVTYYRMIRDIDPEMFT